MNIDHFLNRIELGEYPLIPDSWAQGRTTYGGLTAAIVLHAMQQGVEPDRKLRALDINFTRPFEANSPYHIEVETLGEGKTVCVKNARLIQDGKVRANLRGDFCRPLPNDKRIDLFTPPQLRPIDQCWRFDGPFLPVFFQNMEVYLASKAPPFSGKPVYDMQGWMRYKETPHAITTAHLVGLIDAWPPTAAAHYDKPVPMSTISWHLHFTLDADHFAPTDFLGYHSSVSFEEAGISSTVAYIWRPDGRLLAKSVQTNIIYG